MLIFFKRELVPFGQGGSTVMFENIAAFEVAFLIKEVVDRGMDGGEFLERTDVPEFRHRFFSSSERLV